MTINYLFIKWGIAASFCLFFINLSAYAGNSFPDHTHPNTRADRETVKGIVLDQNGKPLKGVLVALKGDSKSMLTGEDGTFEFERVNAGVITFDHPDFYSQEITYKGKDLQVQLLPKFLRGTEQLAVVNSPLSSDYKRFIDVLHGQQAESTIIQSVGTAYTNQLTTTPASQFLQALPGRIAGLNIAFTSAGPGLDGAGLNYNVRSARGANIILIDGVQRGFLSIDPDQIESVSVLRDALSTVMFGMRSSNGIISITTKKGDKGSPRISFSSQFGLQNPIALPKPLSAGQFATLYNEAQKNDAGTATFTPKYSQADIDAYNNGTDPYGHPDVDWYSAVLKNNSSLNKYNLNFQGSGNGFRYFVDLDKLTETGLLKTLDDNTYNTNAQFDRYLVRTNLGVDVTRSTFVQLNLFGRMGQNNQPGGGTGGIISALATTPRNAYPVFNPDGSLAGSSQYGQNVNIYGQAVQRGYQFQNLRDMAVDIQVKQKLDALTQGLYLKAQGSYNNSSTYTTARAKDFAVFQYNPSTKTYTKFGNTSEQGNTGTANGRARVVYIEGDLGYDKSFGKHNIGAVLVANQQSSLFFDTGNLPENYSDLAARLTYNWAEKYLLEGAGSYAGYSYFSPDKKWATYWAAGAGWNIHKENFIKNNLKFISNLKLRGTYGLTGQANTGYYSYIQTNWTPGSNTNNNDGYYFGTNGVTRSTGQNALATAVGPEKAKKLNAGIDIGLFNNQLTFTGEYFKNKYFDLLGVPGTQTALLGTGYPSINLQKFDYWGSDMTMGWQSHVKNFNYFISGNLSVVQSKVVYNDEIQKKYDYQLTTGRQVNLQFGYIATGLFQSDAEINDPNTAVFASTPKSSLRPGDIRYADRNNDGVINSDDQGAIGSGLPTVYFGATAGFSFKGLDFSVLFQGTGNRQSMLTGDFWNGFGNGGNNNAFEYNMGRWTPETAATATQPRLWVGSNVNNTQTSTFWIKNTDYLRLKNAELGYTFPSLLTRKIGIPSVRLFVNGLNLFTWSELFKVRDDVDPESLNSGSTYPYPNLRTVNFGFNAKF